jgi:hypothetical protein
MSRTKRTTLPGNPRPPANRAASRGNGPASPPDRPATPAYLELTRQLLARVPGELRADERAFYASSIDAADALTWGARVESGAVLDEFLRCANLAREAALAGRVPGYGPLRLRYAAELAVELATRLEDHDRALVSAAGASAAGATSLHATRALRRRALRVLKNLAGRRDDARSRIKTAASDTRRPDERARSLAALADEVERMMQHVPARVAADAGATPELAAALRVAGNAVLAARQEAQGERGGLASSYDELNTLDGRLLNELRLLLAALRDARVHDRSVPAVTSRLVHRPGRKKPAKSTGGGGPAPAP